MKIESKRLILRQITHKDFDSIAAMLRDIEVMYAWEHSFTDTEITAWIDKRIKGYKENGFDYLLAIDKQSGEAIGQIGILKERVGEGEYVGIGYILAKKHWHKGYASEGAKACIKYAFEVLKTEKIIATIRHENEKSINVAKAAGMIRTGQYIKHYNGKDMPHDIYEIKRNVIKL